MTRTVRNCARILFRIPLVGDLDGNKEVKGLVCEVRPLCLNVTA